MASSFCGFKLKILLFCSLKFNVKREAESSVNLESDLHAETSDVYDATKIDHNVLKNKQ